MHFRERDVIRAHVINNSWAGGCLHSFQTIDVHDRRHFGVRFST